MRRRASRPDKSGRGGPVARGLFFTLADVADAVGGKVIGDPRLRLSGVQTLSRAGPEDLSWVADDRRARDARASRAGALIAPSPEAAGDKPCVLVRQSVVALAEWLDHWRPRPRVRAGVSRQARVHPSARLGKGVSIAAGATVAAGARIGARSVISTGAFVGEHAQVGEDSILHVNAVVLERCRIGSRCTLHAGAVVGSDGFGYVWDGDRHRKIPQVGTVRVEDDVEIGANSAIDRATLGETVIEQGSKIDNLVQIGHNVVVGEHSIVCGQTGVAGSARLGRRVTLAGQVGVGDHATVGDGSVVTAQGGVVSRAVVPPGSFISGMPAAPHREFLRRAALVARLPDMARRLDRLEKKETASPAKGGESWNSESPRS